MMGLKVYKCLHDIAASKSHFLVPRVSLSHLGTSELNAFLWVEAKQNWKKSIKISPGCTMVSGDGCLAAALLLSLGTEKSLTPV